LGYLIVRKTVAGSISGEPQNFGDRPALGGVIYAFDPNAENSLTRTLLVMQITVESYT
jgi:hypothetical protein